MISCVFVQAPCSFTYILGHIKFTRRTDGRNGVTMSVNIEEIMDGIRAEIKEKGYTSDMLSFEDVAAVTAVPLGDSDKFDPTEFSGIVSYLDANSTVAVNIPPKGNFIVIFIKKVIRKLIIRPIAHQQSEYNVYSARAFTMLKSYVESLPSPDKITELANKVELLELKLKAANKEIESLTAKLSELEGK